MMSFSKLPVLIKMGLCGVLGLSLCLMGCGPSSNKDNSDVAGRSGPVVTSGVAAIGGPFSLVDHMGVGVTESDLLGRPNLIYFGFAYCPDICPTTLAKLGAMQQILGDVGDDIGYFLITVDPERDTPEKLAEYVSFEPFPRGLRGLSGSLEDIEAAKAAYKAYAQKVPLGGEGGDYTVDHIDVVYLMGADGKFADMFTKRDSPPAMAARVKQLLNVTP